MAQIAFLGGTGPEGLGLAARFALAGERVIIGSREPERAVRAADTLRQRLAAAGRGTHISGTGNRSAAAAADHVVLTLPFAAVTAVLPELAPALAGKIVLDVVNPLMLQSHLFNLAPLPAASAAELIQRLLPQSLVVSGFKHLSARALCHIAQPLNGDVLLCSETPAATRYFLDLVDRIPHLRGIDAGGLANARPLEAMTALLLNLNRRYQATTSVQVLGLEQKRQNPRSPDLAAYSDPTGAAHDKDAGRRPRPAGPT